MQRVINARQWGRFATPFVSIAVASRARVELTSLIKVAMPSVNNFTVQRIVGTMTLLNSSLVAFGSCTLGIMQNTNRVTVTDVSQPDADDASWMYWWGGMVPTQGLAPGWLQLNVDNRSQRKLPELEQVLNLVVENTGTTTLNFACHGRILLGLK